MNVISFHSVLTVLFFVLFIGMVIWVYLPGRKNRYTEASELPFVDEPGFKQEKQSDE